jgi:hypothetical protein
LTKPNPDRPKPFPAGASAKPGRRPAAPNTADERKFDAHVFDLAREQGPEAIATLVAITDDENARGMARLKAIKALLDRGYGRPAKSVEPYGKAGGPIQTEEVSPLESIMSRLAAIRERLEEEGSIDRPDAAQRPTE